MDVAVVGSEGSYNHQHWHGSLNPQFFFFESTLEFVLNITLTVRYVRPLSKKLTSLTLMVLQGV